MTNATASFISYVMFTLLIVQISIVVTTSFFNVFFSDASVEVVAF